jgi:uncharacterized membrane protein HdeD (DUF308 family)
VATGAIAHKDDSQILSLAFALLACLYAVAVASIMMWLKIVYSKYATSECLATEYGLVAVFSIVSSLLFFQEHKDKHINIPVVLSGCGGILAGILVLVTGKYCGRCSL